MKQPRPFQRKRGVALVITLSSVVLLTVLILAFFSRAQLNRRISFSSTNLVKTELLARSAMDIVVGELRQELRDTQTLKKSGVNGADIDVGAYTILNAAGNNTAINTGPNGRPLASDVALDKASVNGRSNAGWFDVKKGPNAGSADLPDWVYLTRNHGVVVNPPVSSARDNSNGNYVIGRFTYTIYDTSGLLDANLAGYPSSAPFATPLSNSGAKASAAYADLAALGFVGGAGGQIDKLVQWRNAAITASAKSAAEKAVLFDEWATGVPRAAGTLDAEDLAALSSGQSGHLSISTGNNIFLSRQDLLKFGNANGISANAMRFLTHFSRTPNLPVWAPQKNASEMGGNNNGGLYAYKDAAAQAGAINRDLGSLVVNVSTQLKHYRDDGPLAQYLENGLPVNYYTIPPGGAFLQKPFSLAKISWLGLRGPATASLATPIKDCFGLTWNDPKRRWEYNHDDASGILTLEEVRMLEPKREPDFFELLKAAILSGSLGKHPGVVCGSPIGEPNPAGVPGQFFERYSDVEDRQILQIGANIIDQADPGNFPTAIHQVHLAESTPEEEFYNTVFGIENLPYLSKIGVITAKDDQLNSKSIANTWIQPELWNPHFHYTADAAYPSTAGPQHETPSKLRLVTIGKTQAWNMTEEVTAPNPDMHGPWVTFGQDPYNPSLNGTIYFKNSKDFFTKPLALTNAYADPGEISGPKNLPLPLGTTTLPGLSANNFLAVWTGEVSRWPERIIGYGKPKPDGSPSPLYALGHTIKVVTDNSVPRLTLILEFYDGNTWRPYTSMSRLTEIPEQLFSGGALPADDPKTRWGRAAPRSLMGRPDPRTDRFSVAATVDAGASQASIWEWNRSAYSPDKSTDAAPYKGGLQYGFPTAPGFTHTVDMSQKAWGRRYFFHEWGVNSASSAFRYSDRDGVIRPGDSHRADWSNASAGDGLMPYNENIQSASAPRRRPVVLNRPFRSVGELGNVFRDLPFKNLDLWSDKSADAGLLAVFSVADTDGNYTAGKINPNAAPPSVLKALLSGAAKDPEGSALLSATDAELLAKAMVAEISPPSGTALPLLQQSDLVDRLGQTFFNAFTAPADKRNKRYGETPMRVLAQTANPRALNLLIDVAAQSGRIGGSAGTLGDFVVEGERRYWMHVSIERSTGKIISQQIESIYD